MVHQHIKRAIEQTASCLLLGLLAIVLPSGLAYSDEGHPHKESGASGEKHEHRAPHGGRMVTIGSHHTEEVVESGGVIKVFLYDSDDRSVAVKGISGQIHLTFPDNHRETLELIPSADHTDLSARMKDQDHPSFKAVLSLVIDRQRKSIRLNW